MVTTSLSKKSICRYCKKPINQDIRNRKWFFITKEPTHNGFICFALDPNLSLPHEPTDSHVTAIISV